MAAEWDVVPGAVLDLAGELIKKHHPNLRNARIGIVFRSEASSVNGKRVLGKAEKINAKWKPLLREDLDFVIWLAADFWLGEATPMQQKALLDHELCHCKFDQYYNPVIVGHDIEEFNAIILRYGNWLEEMKYTAAAFQPHIPTFGRTGFIHSILPEVKEKMEAEFDDVEVSISPGYRRITDDGELEF